MASPAPAVCFGGRILFLTEDASLLEAQLAGEDLADDVAASAPLLGNISTDEITPGWVCYYYDETLGRYCLVGLRGGKVAAGRDQERRLLGHRQRHRRRGAARRARRRRTASSRRA